MITLEKLNEMNHWWKAEGVKKELAPDFKRDLYFEIQKYLNLRQIIAIIGLRRTGKSTLFYQLISELIDKKVNPENLLYFSFDESKTELSDLINFYKENIIKKDINKDRFYIFLDEVQKLDDWENKIKIYYDLYPNLKFFISGSASINILLNSKESLAGRIFYFQLDPLSFEEFLRIKGKEVVKIQKNINLWGSELRTEINEYLLKPFPEIVNVNDDIAKKYIKESIIDKAIFRDLSALFEVKDIELIEILINIIASNPGMRINLEDISKDLKRSRQVISNYLYYLEYCFILKSLRNFRGSLRVSSRKLKKYYLIHPSIALALSSPEKGKIIENLVQFKTKSDYYWREGKNEADFVKLQEKIIIPIESKYSDNIKIKDIKGLIKFTENFKIKEGTVVTKELEKTEEIKGAKSKITIHFIPLWKWLLQEQ
ncbi:hypothetical protein A3K73_02830 [Candidatus Pacearchaeota archaeon RBG_13_36_9]|nr:MAG: hypothetical protein A3K73_02830 [Candidatus Pacearchaeota archaeon RBG_13_36_9]